jgi:hypothetical protein
LRPGPWYRNGCTEFAEVEATHCKIVLLSDLLGKTILCMINEIGKNTDELPVVSSGDKFLDFSFA